jgi:threonine aldolase
MRTKLGELALKQNIVLPSGNNMRLVTHLNINDKDIKAIIDVFKEAS